KSVFSAGRRRTHLRFGRRQNFTAILPFLYEFYSCLVVYPFHRARPVKGVVKRGRRKLYARDKNRISGAKIFGSPPSALAWEPLSQQLVDNNLFDTFSR